MIDNKDRELRLQEAKRKVENKRKAIIDRMLHEQKLLLKKYQSNKNGKWPYKETPKQYKERRSIMKKNMLLSIQLKQELKSALKKD